MKVNFIPAVNKYLVRPDNPEESKNGILLADSAQEKPMEGVVVAVGPKSTLNRTAVGKIESHYGLNDHLVYRKYSGEEINIDGEIFLIIEEEDILGKRT